MKRWPAMTPSIYLIFAASASKDLCLCVQLPRDLHFEVDIKIASSLRALQHGHAAPSHPEDLLRLGAGWDGQDDFPGQGSDFHLAAQDGRENIHRQVGMQIVPIALEERVLGHIHDEIEIGWTAIRAGRARSRNADLCSGANPGRDLHIHPAAAGLEGACVPVKASFRLMDTGCWMDGAPREVRPRSACPA